MKTAVTDEEIEKAFPGWVKKVRVFYENLAKKEKDRALAAEDELEKLLESAFKAGRDYEYAENFQRPSSRPNFKEWKEQALNKIEK